MGSRSASPLPVRTQPRPTRLTYWEYGLNTLDRHPVVGIGFRNWGEYVAAKYPEILNRAGNVEVMHNTFLEAGTELGYPGLILLMLTLVFIAIVNVRTARAAALVGDTWSLVTAKGLVAQVPVFMIASFFMSVLWYPYIWIMLSMTLVVAHIVGGRYPARARSDAPFDCGVSHRLPRDVGPSRDA